MRTFLQNCLLGLYRKTLNSGLLSTRFGKTVFEHAYPTYKQLIEAGDVELLRNFVRPGQTVIDVGANIGFFTLKFARWVGPHGQVIAIEPEKVNFCSLSRRIAKAGYMNTVNLVHAAAAESRGELRLAVNPHSPTDHWLAPDGIAVTATTIDHLLTERGWPAVSLIKIDVQGAEERVLKGAAKTLANYKPALFVEMDETGLTRAGTSAQALLDGLIINGYQAHVLKKKAISEPLTPSEVLNRIHDRGYTDFLFLHGE